MRAPGRIRTSSFAVLVLPAPKVPFSHTIIAGPARRARHREHLPPRTLEDRRTPHGSGPHRRSPVPARLRGNPPPTWRPVRRFSPAGAAPDGRGVHGSRRRLEWAEDRAGDLGHARLADAAEHPHALGGG